MANITTNPSIRDSFVANLRAIVANLIAEMQNRHLVRVTENELMSLSARELEDLGLTRSSIKSAARQSVFGR